MYVKKENVKYWLNRYEKDFQKKLEKAKTLTNKDAARDEYISAIRICYYLDLITEKEWSIEYDKAWMQYQIAEYGKAGA